MSIGDRIKAARKEKSLTQTELGKKLNVSQSMIAQYERGDRIPNDDTLQRIAAILDVSYYELSENDSVESLLRAQESVSHSLQRDLEVIVYEIRKLQDKIYSTEDKDEKKSLKGKLDEKQKEKDYIRGKLESARCDIEELRKYLYEIQYLQKKQLNAQSQAEKDVLCQKIVELKDNANNVIKKRTANRIQINTSIKADDIDIELNNAFQKASRQEELTPSERAKLNNYIQSEEYKNAWKRFKETMPKHLETIKRLQAAYERLNDAGLERIAEQIELIAKIPEYQKEPEQKTAAPEREPQDGETDTQ